MSPYAYSGAHVRIAFSPFFIVATPLSQPRITSRAPSVNSNGVPRLTDESNTVPSVSLPV